MSDDESFNTFFLRFDRISGAARFDDGQKLYLIRPRSNDMDNKLHKVSPLSTLPSDAILICRQENYDFKKTIKYLREADKRLRLSESTTNKKVNVGKQTVVSTKPFFNPKCGNCSNLGHTAHNCLLKAQYIIGRMSTTYCGIYTFLSGFSISTYDQS